MNRRCPRPAAILPALLVSCGLAVAQQSAITVDPIDCFQISGALAANFRIVPVEGQPFSRAMRVRSSSSTNAWDIRIRCFQTAAASRGDTLVGRFWMCTISAENGTGVTALVVERNSSPFTKSVQLTTGAGPEWRKVEVPFTMAETYSAGTSAASSGSYHASLWLAYGVQEIEIADVSFVNHGPSVPFSSLGLADWPYEGYHPDTAWRRLAAYRIEKLRKSDIAVVVRDDNGSPVPNAHVRIRMKRHAFPFGSAVSGEELRANSVYADAFKRLFNAAVTENDLKWPFWETWSRTSAAYALDWLAQNKIIARGHNVIWPDRGNLPPDVGSLIDRGDREALRTKRSRNGL